MVRLFYYIFASKLKLQSMTSRVEVRPLDREKWHRKTGKESFMQPQTIEALADVEKMEYAVDFSDQDRKFFKDKKVRYDLSLHYDPEVPHPFWGTKTARVKLENKTMFFNKALPLDRVKIGIMKGSRYVANSKKEWNEGLYPDATHFIHDESEEAEAKASKVELSDTAIIECSKLAPERKIQLIKVLTGGNMKNQSPDFITVKIRELIDKNPALVLKTINRNKKEIATLALVYEAIDKGILRKDGHNIKYLDSVLGMDEEEVVKYFMDDKNQEFYLLIKEKTTK